MYRVHLQDHQEDEHVVEDAGDSGEEVEAGVLKTAVKKMDKMEIIPEIPIRK